MPWLITRRWDRVAIVSDDPQKEVWFRLSAHESEYAVRENLRRFYTEEGISYDEAALPAIATYFVRSLRQAREYFTASKSVSLMTRPLLLFYGMVCFSKLLILTRNPEYQRLVSSEKALQQHGLGYQDNRSEGHLIDNDLVRMQPNGTFSELYKCFKKELPARTEYSISGLYQWIPDLYAHYLVGTNLFPPSLGMILSP